MSKWRDMLLSKSFQDKLCYYFPFLYRYLLVLSFSGKVPEGMHNCTIIETTPCPSNKAWDLLPSFGWYMICHGVAMKRLLAISSSKCRHGRSWRAPSSPLQYQFLYRLYRFIFYTENENCTKRWDMGRKWGKERSQSQQNTIEVGESKGGENQFLFDFPLFLT